MRPRRRVEPTRPVVPHSRINEDIRAPKVRLVDEDGAQIGVKHTNEALEYAQGKNLDLVEVAAQADPPVARVMDYGKYRYEQEQKAKLARKHQVSINVKEIKLRPKIGIHDYDTKKGHVVRFLNQRAKVKVTIMFRGREKSHPERGRDLLMRLAEDVKEIGLVESPPLQDGRNMVMVLGPTKNAGVEKDAEAEDTQRSEEAVQADGDRQAAAPEGDEEPPASGRSQRSASEFRQDQPSIPRTTARSSAAGRGRDVDAARQALRPAAQAPQECSSREGLRRHAPLELQAREGAGRASARPRLPRPQEPQADMRRLWIMRINAAARAEGLSYNQFVAGCRKAGIELDRKVLATIAVDDPAAFGKIAEQAKAALWQQAQATSQVFRARRPMRGPVAALRASAAALRRRPVAAEIVGPEPRGTCRCGCSADCTTSCSAVGADWDDPLEQHRGFLSDFVATQGVQTNEVQRCWVLLPLLLASPSERAPGARPRRARPERRPEPLWDRYGYRYEAGERGRVDAVLRLRGRGAQAGAARAARAPAEVRARVGIDRTPIDVTTEQGRAPAARVRLGRAGGAPAAARPGDRGAAGRAAELVRGDYVELLPEVLAARHATG